MGKRRSQLIVIVGLWCMAILVIFGGYELAERLWLKTEDMGLIHTLHILRGIGSSAVTALIIGIYLIKKRSPAAILGGPLSYLPSPKTDTICRQAVWFIHMRWIVILATTFAIVYACWFSDILPRENFLPLLICIIVLFVANVLFSFSFSTTSKPYQLIVAQVVVDLIVLTFLLHFSGGLENPFYLVYIFHVIIVSIILSRRDAILIAALTCLLFMSLVTVELLGLVHHSYIGLFPHGDSREVHASHDFLFVVGRSITFLLVLGFTTYFTILLREQIRQNEASVIQASKLAAIGELVGRIAHEINNPIGVISTKTKLLLENRGLSDKVTSDLEKIDKHSNRIAGLTQGLLIFCRPSLGEKSSLNLNRVIQSTFPLIDTGRKGRRIQMAKVLGPTISPICGNVNEIQQIILNIINNAIDAMPDGGELRIETQNEKDKVVLSIADTGPGIPRQIIGQIFDPFFTTKEEGEGTGLGLSITHGLVRSHGGTIEVESKEGKGTTFVIRFPSFNVKGEIDHEENQDSCS